MAGAIRLATPATAPSPPRSYPWLVANASGEALGYAAESLTEEVGFPAGPRIVSS
jgi:hypothetical protein